MSGDHAGPAATVAATVRRLESLLEQAAPLEAFLARSSPANGARIVARAWVDPAFRDRLLADANAALPEIGLSMSGGLQDQRLKVVANTSEIHNVIVCTLCSCYPIALLGPSPTWYKSEAYRSRVVRDPRGVLAEFGFTLPDSVTVNVWDASAESRYMVLPLRPPGTEHLDEPALGQLVTRNGLIGVAPV